MKSGTIVKKDHDSSERDTGINEALLRAEINFWKEMISSCNPSHAQEPLERMEQALALAEWRLASLFRDYQDAYSSGSFNSLPSNVYSISGKSPPCAQKPEPPNK